MYYVNNIHAYNCYITSRVYMYNINVFTVCLYTFTGFCTIFNIGNTRNRLPS